MNTPARNQDIRHAEHEGWFSRFDARHPTAATLLVTMFLLVGMGLAGWADAPLVA